jgi:hypothetical protein
MSFIIYVQIICEEENEVKKLGTRISKKALEGCIEGQVT